MESQSTVNVSERDAECERLFEQYRAGLSLYVEALAEISSAERQLRGLHCYRKNLDNLSARLREIERSFGLQCFKTNVELEFLLENLSDREFKVFELLGQGFTTLQIAAHLKRAVSTIETYRERIKVKLDLSSGAELERQAFQWAFQRRSDVREPMLLS